MDYLSLFSGYGGFELGIEDAIEDAHCIGFSEIDKWAQAVYQQHFPKHNPLGDAKQIIPGRLPDFRLLVGGFPCQSFSIAGKRGGFDDTRGTLFFDVARILKAKRPEWILLENVKGLCSHDGGRTLGTIYRVLTDIGYTVGWKVVNSCKFGVPQNRERIFIVGHLTEAGGRTGEVLSFEQGDPRIIQDETENEGKEYSWALRQRDYKDGTNFVAEKVQPGTLRTHKDGRGFRESKSGLVPTIPARGREDGSGQPVIKINKEGKIKNTQHIAACLTGGGNSGGNHSDMDLLAIPTYCKQQGSDKPVVRAVLTPDRLKKRQNGRRFKTHDEPSFTLTAQDKHGVQVGTMIRRLTPIECERLQGLPDGYTSTGVINGEKVDISDSQRYKMLGNGVTVPVVSYFIEKMFT